MQCGDSRPTRVPCIQGYARNLAGPVRNLGVDDFCLYVCQALVDQHRLGCRRIVYDESSHDLRSGREIWQADIRLPNRSCHALPGLPGSEVTNARPDWRSFAVRRLTHSRVHSKVLWSYFDLRASVSVVKAESLLKSGSASASLSSGGSLKCWSTFDSMS